MVEDWRTVWLSGSGAVEGCALPGTLGDSVVHVWRVSLEAWAPHVETLRSCLSADETARAARFRFARDYTHFVVARGLLRAMLGAYLGLRPGEVHFRYGPHGKPSLADGLRPARLRFNVTHSGGLALVAVALDREVGVDLEQIRPLPDMEEVARRFFSPVEWDTLRGLPAAEQPGAFFACWTRKEAYIKARGEGLSRRLDSFDVSLAPGVPAQLLAVRGDAEEEQRWSLRDLDAGPGFAAALAAEGQGWHLQCWHAGVAG
jgi:4'-phosphopantetheinyl transferase